MFLDFFQGWPNGWCLMCDILLRMPVSLFVKLVNFSYDIPDLVPNYLNHPIRQHYLIQNLPQSIKQLLLHQRKYIFSIHEIVVRLCYIGLVQFGPQKLKEKDQIFVYLNTKATLADTTSCSRSYHQIDPDEAKSFMRKGYQFKDITDLEKYW